MCNGFAVSCICYLASAEAVPFVEGLAPLGPTPHKLEGLQDLLA